MDSGSDVFGDYSGGTSYSGTLTEGQDFDTYYIDLTIGEVSYVDVGIPASTCHEYRPIIVKVFTAGNNSLAIEESWITYDDTTKLLTVNAADADTLAAHPY